MLVRRVRVFFVIVLLVFSQPIFAQMPRTTSKNSGPREQMAKIIFSGLGGAILGLSTLSFYGRPQDKLANIAIGFALGVMVGTAYVTYRAATLPFETYVPYGAFNDYQFSPSTMGVDSHYDFDSDRQLNSWREQLPAAHVLTLQWEF